MNIEKEEELKRLAIQSGKQTAKERKQSMSPGKILEQARRDADPMLNKASGGLSHNTRKQLKDMAELAAANEL